MNLDVSPVFGRLISAYQNGFKKFALEGGSRSTKSWSIILLLFHYCWQNTGKHKRITIARSRRTWIKDTIYKDIIECAEHFELPIKCTDKTELIFNCYGNEIQLIGLDDPQKAHGRKQHITWLNEAIEVPWISAAQLMQRTEEIQIFDWNPSQSKHWLFDKIIPQPDVFHDHSTFNDNPFLPAMVRNQLKSYELTPENIANGTADAYMWEVYGLGLRAERKGKIYPSWRTYTELPDSAKFVGYGIDFGYNDPMVVVAMWLDSTNEPTKGIYFKEIIYQSELTDTMLAARMSELELNPSDDYCADAANKGGIATLRQLGFRVYKCNKGADSIEHGIKLLKSQPVYVHAKSANMLNEVDSYCWKLGIDGEPMDQPVDRENHAMDAARYIATWHLDRRPLVFS